MTRASIQNLISDILEVGGVVLAILIAVSYLKAWLLERQIEELYKKRDEELKLESGRPVAMEIMRRRMNAVSQKYRGQMNPLIRQRRYILEKLPFLRK